MKRSLNLLLCGALLLSLICPILAVERQSDIAAAAECVREKRIMVGTPNGDMNLDSGLTRAELAAILTRIDGEGAVDPKLYTWACYFTDVPNWAKSYVGYCVAALLMNGYNSTSFGPHDAVTPAMACTVMLRCCGHENSEGSKWTYGTACDYAVSLGWISPSTAQTSAITRGEMAVLICRAMGWLEPVPFNSTVTGPYTVAADGSLTISQDSWSREDFSKDANPAVFTGVYTRELYNAIRQTMVDGTPGEFPAYTMVSKEDYSAAVTNVLGRMEGVVWYEHYVPSKLANYWQYLDYFAMEIKYPDNYQAPLEFVQPALAEAAQMGTDREKVTYLNDYLCTLLTYEKSKTAGVTRTFSQHSSELPAACSSYAIAFKFLCAAADIPCFTVSTDIHTWNMVYADGQWLQVDVSLNDLTNSHTMLLKESYPNQTDLAPEQTAFIKELLVPGSTK